MDGRALEKAREIVGRIGTKLALAYTARDPEEAEKKIAWSEEYLANALLDFCAEEDDGS